MAFISSANSTVVYCRIRRGCYGDFISEDLVKNVTDLLNGVLQKKILILTS